MNEQDPKEEIRIKIRGCFGSQDLIFASHKLDEDFAKDLAYKAMTNGMRINDMMTIVTDFLKGNGVTEHHLMNEELRARAFFSSLDKNNYAVLEL